MDLGNLEFYPVHHAQAFVHTESFRTRLRRILVWLRSCLIRLVRYLGSDSFFSFLDLLGIVCVCAQAGKTLARLWQDSPFSWQDSCLAQFSCRTVCKTMLLHRPSGWQDLGKRLASAWQAPGKRPFFPGKRRFCLISRVQLCANSLASDCPK